MSAAATLLSKFPETRTVISQIGGSNDGLDPMGFESVCATILLQPKKDWPPPPDGQRPRTRAELKDKMEADLGQAFPGVEWEVTLERRDIFQAAFVADPGTGLLKIFGPDLGILEKLADRARQELAGVEGIKDVHICHLLGLEKLNFPIDPEKCTKWGVMTADVNLLIQMIWGKTVTTMVEGEKQFDVTLRWPERLCNNEEAILNIPVNVVFQPFQPMPRVRLGDLVAPQEGDGQANPKGRSNRSGAAVIYREQGLRMIGVRFRVHGRSGAKAMAEAQQKLAPLFAAPYRATWTSDF